MHQQEWARSYISAVQWRFAETMPQWPHEYTVRSWDPSRTIDFEKMAMFTRELGVVRPWPDNSRPRYHHSYWELDGWEYWIMDGPITDTQVINRARACEAQETSPSGRGPDGFVEKDRAVTG